MALDKEQNKPHDALARILADDMDAVNTLIQKRMASEHAPRIPEVTAHLVNAGGKRLYRSYFIYSFCVCSQS